VCGISGYIGQPDPAILREMARSLSHRGPDDAGILIDREVGLAHSRLSIVGIEDGAQPLVDCPSESALVFNGEIYSHPELRRQLERRGYQYRTHTDSETILHAWQHWGIDCLTRFEGMFSFVLYDRQKRLLFGARDRLGQKPFYYTNQPFGDVAFAFGSEIKALRCLPQVDEQLNLSESGLLSYLLHDYVVSPGTIFDGVQQLEPGHAMIYGLPGSSQPGLRTWKYWHNPIDAPAPAALEGISEDEAAERLFQLLQTAVERRLMSDVPVGLLLSGGIDSTVILSLLSRMGVSTVKSFSIGVSEKGFDESQAAKESAQLFNAEHYARQFTPQDCNAQLEQVAEYLDEPFADSSVLPTSFVCQLASEHVKVALGGDGADDLIAGYAPFHALRAAVSYRRMVPSWLHQLMLGAAGSIPDSGARMSLAFKVQRFLRGAHEPAGSRVPAWMAPCTVNLLSELLPDVSVPPSQLWEQLHATGAPADDMQHALRSFQRYYLSDGILAKVDRASSIHSLEVRSPFLDRDLVEFINQLPSHFKFRKGSTKYLLRRIIGDHQLMPEHFLNRKKKGFGVPVSAWIRGSMRESVQRALVDEWPDRLAMFDKGIVQRLLNRHCSGRTNYSKEIWALYMLSEWAKRHLGTRAGRWRREADSSVREVRMPQPAGAAKVA
jgi:asparagine synthase (glutamine-hydrolysing)